MSALGQILCNCHFSNLNSYSMMVRLHHITYNVPYSQADAT